MFSSSGQCSILAFHELLPYAVQQSTVVWTPHMTSILKVFEATIPTLTKGMHSVSNDRVEVEYDDGGHALIVEMFDTSETNGFCVELRSWDDTKEHEKLRSIMGKTVRITVEVID